MTNRLPRPDPAGTCLVVGDRRGDRAGARVSRPRRDAGGPARGAAARTRRGACRGARRPGGGTPGWSGGSRAVAALPSRVKQLGVRVDVLVNNAGLGGYGRFVELAREVEQVRVMCETVVSLCGAFVPAMVERGSGAVLIVSSTTGFQPTARYATYAAAKAFSLSFGQSLHEELRRSGVAVTTVCPGPVETDFFGVNDVRPVRLPKAMWASADEVARAALEGLARNRRVVVPGRALRALMAGSRLSPAGLQLRVMDVLLPRQR